MSRYSTGGKDFSATNSNHSSSSTENGNTRNDESERNDSSAPVASGHNMSRDMNNSNNTNNFLPTVTPCGQSRQSRQSSSGKGFYIPPSLRTLPAESTTFPLFPPSSSYELDHNMSPFTRYNLIHPPHNTTARQQQQQQTHNNTARTFPDTSLSTTANASRTTTTTSQQPFLCTKKCANHLSSKPAQ